MNKQDKESKTGKWSQTKSPGKIKRRGDRGRTDDYKGIYSKREYQPGITMTLQVLGLVPGKEGSSLGTMPTLGSGI